MTSVPLCAEFDSTEFTEAMLIPMGFPPRAMQTNLAPRLVDVTVSPKEDVCVPSV